MRRIGIGFGLEAMIKIDCMKKNYIKSLILISEVIKADRFYFWGRLLITV